MVFATPGRTAESSTHGIRARTISAHVGRIQVTHIGAIAAIAGRIAESSTHGIYTRTIPAHASRIQ
eukprot:566502-Pelagomonas_calceolata.AAC.1